MTGYRPVYIKLIMVTMALAPVLIGSVLLGLTIGSSGEIGAAWHVLLGQGKPDATLEVIIWQLRWPRVILAATVGASLSLGGLVFQALLATPSPNLTSSVSPAGPLSGQSSASLPGSAFFRAWP